MPSFSATTGGVTAAPKPGVKSVGRVEAQVAAFDEPLLLAVRAVAAALRARVRDVRHAQRRRVERRADLPRAERVAPRRRHLRERSGERRLVGQHDRAGQARRHAPVLRRRREQPRQLLRLDRAAVDQPGHRTELGRRLPAGDGRGLGRRAGAAGRPAGHRAVRRRDGREPGRHAGAVVGDPLSAAHPARAGDRGGAQPVRAEHRVQRGRAGGDHDRPRLPRRALRRARARCRAGACASRG